MHALMLETNKLRKETESINKKHEKKDEQLAISSEDHKITHSLLNSLLVITPPLPLYNGISKIDPNTGAKNWSPGPLTGWRRYTSKGTTAQEAGPRSKTFTLLETEFPQGSYIPGVIGAETVMNPGGFGLQDVLKLYKDSR